jgi:peptide/nickel transport system substrate-binding protein
MITRARAGDLDFNAQRWIADYPDSDSFMMGLLHSDHGVLGRLCGSPDIDRRLKQGRRENDPALRHAIYRELEDLLAREALLVPLFHEQTYRIAHPNTRGLRVGLSMPEVRYEELWTEQ